MARLRVGTSLLLTAAATALPATAAAKPSLYHGPGPRPGPDILYRAPDRASQLQNHGIWGAKPILVSGASAYRHGEFLYQDYGAKGSSRDPNDPRTSQDPSFDSFSLPNGTYTYPSDPAYANNAADLVELRVRALADSTAFRVTLNSLKDPSLVAFTIAIGGSGDPPRPFPFGANVVGPVDYFLTVHPSGSGMVAELVNAATGHRLSPGSGATVDMTRRQIDVRVPHQAWDPTGEQFRLAAGVGLWDTANNRYLVPQQ